MNADNKLVITVAAQKDICPHGKKYTINAVSIKRNKKETIGSIKYKLTTFDEKPSDFYTAC